MEPVEIDIRMRQNVEEESKKASSSVRSLNNEAKKAREEVGKSIAIQKKVLSELRSELSLLEKDFKKVNVSTQDPKVSAEKAKLSQAVRNLRNEIKLEEKALQGLEKRQQSYTNKSQNLETEIRNVRNEMAALKMQGKANTQEYRVLEERLGLLGTAYKELTATQKALSTGGTQMAGILSGLNAVSGAFTASAGAMGLVNNNSEDMEKIQTRLQSMMSITIGLQQVSNTLHETSAFRITTVRKAKELWAIASTKAATALGITNIQAQILMGTLTLGLSVAITAAVAALDKYVSKKQEAAEAEKAFTKAVADNSADVLAKYQQMRVEWEKLGNSLKDKEQYVRDNQDAFNGLGVAISDVNDADNLFVRNTDSFKQAVLERARAAAYMELATEKYKKTIGRELEIEAMPNEVVVADDVMTTMYGTSITTSTKKALNLAKESAKLELTKKRKEIDELILQSVKSSDNAKRILEGTGVDEFSKNSKKFWEKQKKDAEIALSLMTDAEKGTAKWGEQLKKYNEAKKALGAWNFNENESKKTLTSKEKAAKDFAKLQVQIENESNTIALQAMDEGVQKKLAKIDAEYKLKKQRIETRRKELQENEKLTGKTAPQSHAQLDNDLKNIKITRDNAKKTVNTAFAQEQQKQFADLLKKYQTYEDKKTEILKRYEAERKKIEAKNTDGQYDANLEKLEEAEAKELFALEKSAGEIKSAIAVVFSDLSGKSIEELEKMLGKARDVQKLLGSAEYNEKLGLDLGIDKKTWEELKNNASALAAINAKVKELARSTKSFGDHLKTLFKKDKSVDEFEYSFDKVYKTIQASIGATKMFSNALGDIAKITGSGFLGDVADGISNVADVAGQGLQGMQQGKDIAKALGASGATGMAVGAALGVVTGVLGKISQARKEHQQALLRIEKARYAQQMRYNELLFKQQLAMKDKESIFGVDAISKAVGYLAIYNDQLKKLQDKLTKKNGKVKGVFGISQESFQSELDKIEVKTGHRRGGLFRHGKDYFGSITEIEKYKDIIDKEGNLNINRAEAILASEQFKDGHKEKLEEIISLYKQTQEAEEAFAEYTKQTFGELGDSIIDSVVNSLKNGEDAFEAFAEAVGNIMGKVGKQIMYELFVSSRFKEFQKELRGIYENGAVYKTEQRKGHFGRSRTVKVKDAEATLKNVGSKVREAVGSFANSMRGEIELMRDFAKEWQKQTKDMGFDVWGNDDAQRSTASKGIAQASQDSIDDLLGRVYALVRFVNEIKEYEALVVNYDEEGISIQSAMLEHLNQIAHNTSYNHHLEGIANDMDEMKTQGIKVKM